MRRTKQTTPSENIDDLIADIEEKSNPPSRGAEVCIYCNDNTAKDHRDKRYADHIREHLAPPDDEFLKYMSNFLRRNAHYSKPN